MIKAGRSPALMGSHVFSVVRQAINKLTKRNTHSIEALMERDAREREEGQGATLKRSDQVSWRRCHLGKAGSSEAISPGKRVLSRDQHRSEAGVGQCLCGKPGRTA